MKYKYQMHSHTVPCSKCAITTPVELIDALVTGGYSGCVITNHFFGGNTGIDRNLPWKEFVAEYENNYLQIKKLGQKHNLDIIFSIEEHIFDGLEILCYGITPEFLYNSPQLCGNRSIKDWSNALRKFGALCIQAHPFRARGYIKNPRLLDDEFIDGIEVFNAYNKPEENALASLEANKHKNWILTAGGDTHSAQNVCWSGIQTTSRIKDEKALVNVLKSRDYELII